MVELIKSIFAGFTETISGLASGLKDAFLQLIYVDPTAETLVISDLAKFGFIMIGLSMAIGIVYAIFRMIKR